tara:strand:+ start:613 stop:780 length:168 start_codon:yes stop_codon:yes gene_type:complete
MNNITPTGKLKPLQSDTPFVNVTGCGKRRKHVDENGMTFVKCKGQWHKFPEGVEY